MNPLLRAQLSLLVCVGILAGAIGLCCQRTKGPAIHRDRAVLHVPGQQISRDGSPDNVLPIRPRATAVRPIPAPGIPARASLEPVTSWGELVEPRAQSTAVPVSAEDLSWRESSTRMHRVIDGESLASLAERYLGSRQRAGEIFDWNRDRLAHPDVLPLGVYLRIPPKWGSVPAQIIGPHRNVSREGNQELVPLRSRQIGVEDNDPPMGDCGP